MLCDPAGCQTPTPGRELHPVSPLGKICIDVSPQNGANPQLTRLCGRKGQTPEEAEKKRRYEAWYRGFLAWRQRTVLYTKNEKDTFKTLVRCGAYAVPKWVKNGEGHKVPTGSPGHVQAHRYAAEDGEALGYAWTMRCSSPFFCFHCGPRLARKRRDEIKQGAEVLLEKGWRCLFVTFTAPHDLNTEPDDQVRRFQDAQRWMRQGKAWQRFKWIYRLCGHIRATEMTDDAPGLPDEAKSGCHWHSHWIVWFERSLSAVEFERVKAFLQNRWLAALEHVGLVPEGKADAVRRVGCKVERPRKPNNPDEVLDYVSKNASFEIAPAPLGKAGRGERRISHWEILRLAFSGERPELVQRAIAIMKALKGRQWITWSNNLKAMCGISEQSDEELLKEEKGEAVFNFDKEAKKLGVDWWKINYWKQQKRLINAVQDAQEGKSAFSPGVELEAEEAFRALGRMLSQGIDPLTGEDLESAYQAVAAPVPPLRE